MNKVTRIALGVGLFLLFSGGILSAAGWLMGGDTAMLRDQEGKFGFSRPGVQVVPTLTPPVATVPPAEDDADVDAFDRIEIEVAAAEVTVVRGKHYDVSLTWSGTGYELGYRVEDGCLKVQSQPEDKAGNVSGTIIITIPQGTVLQDAEIYLGIGDIVVEDQVFSSQVTVNTGLGDVAISGELQDGMQIYTGVGDVSVSGALRGDSSIATGVGKIAFATSLDRSEYDLNVDVGLGSISCDGETAKELEGGGGDFRLEADNGLGDITLSFGEAA